MVLPLLVAIVVLRARFNWKTAIRQSPRLLEPTTGYITPRGLYHSSNASQGFHHWEDFHGIRSTKNGVLISGENWRLVSLIIPWDSFSDPAMAELAIGSVLEQRKNWKPIPLGDPRMLAEPEDSPIFQPSDPHVNFEGEITARHVIGSRPGKILRRKSRLLLIVIGIMFLPAILLASSGSLAWLMISLPLMFFCVFLFLLLMRNPLMKRDTDAGIFRLRGWFQPNGFYLQSINGQSFRGWPSLADQWHDEHMLCIALPGATQAWFFFSRTQFASQDDFQQACQWAATGLSSESTA